MIIACALGAKIVNKSEPTCESAQVLDAIDCCPKLCLPLVAPSLTDFMMLIHTLACMQSDSGLGRVSMPRLAMPVQVCELSCPCKESRT